MATGKFSKAIKLLEPISTKETENNTDIWRANLHMSVAYYYLQDKEKSNAISWKGIKHELGVIKKC